MILELHKGYIMTRNKISQMKFKDKGTSELLSLSVANQLPEYAGVLDSNTILIDIDNPKQFEILFKIVKNLRLKCRVYKSNRGGHFYFWNRGVEDNKTHTKLAIGLTADIKVGSRNSYAVLKFQGKDREVLYDTKEYQQIPNFLLPVSTKKDFIGLGEGEGRNQSLFSYILTLQKHNFAQDEIKQCIRLINDYVLDTPLEEHELEVILRDEAFGDEEKSFFQNKKFLFDKFAKYLVNNLKIIRINGQLHFYKDGIYKTGDYWIESKMIDYIPSLNGQQRSEVLKYMKLLVKTDKNLSPPHLIAFNNGIYDLECDNLVPFAPDIVLTNHIPWNYNPQAYSEVADKTLDKLACQDNEIRCLLEECIGSCFYSSNTLGGGKAFILTGGGANGKSTYLTMIQNMLGEENISSLDLKELDVKFQNAELFGKLANIGDDISDEFITNLSVFKKLVTGNRIQVQRKGERPFEFNNYAKMLFSANNLPRIKDKTGAIMRRLLLIPFDAKFTVNDEDYDEHITYKLQTQEVMEYLILLGLKGLKRVIDNHNYTKSKKVQEELEEYEIISNPILLFFKEEITEDDVLNEPTNDIYRKYTEFCINNNFNQMSNMEFGRQVSKYFQVKSKCKKINGEVIRIYIRKR